MSASAGLEVANVGINKPFSNTRDWDVLLYASESNQALLIGCGIDSSKPATLTVSNSNVVFARDVNVSGVFDAVTLRQGGSNLSSM